MNLVFVFLLMLFCHIADDYYLQGVLANLKQKIWWQKNAPDILYKNDYIMALIMHSMSWSFMIMLPPTIALMVTGGIWKPVLLIVNLMIHMFVDNLKANEKKINLIQDQMIHIIQVIFTWWVLIGIL